jgi:hypothetical protein
VDRHINIHQNFALEEAMSCYLENNSSEAKDALFVAAECQWQNKNTHF